MRKNKYNKSKTHKKQAPKPKNTQQPKAQKGPVSDSLHPLLVAQAAILKAQHAQEMAEREAVYKAQLNILMQFSEDACLLATSDVRGLGATSAAILRNEFRKTLNEMSAMLADDEDKEVIYGRTKIDQALERIEGKDKARPWEERLAWCFAPMEEKK